MLSGGAACPEVETSRPIGAFTLTNHTRSTQPAKDETFECSPSPGVAADCRRKAPNRPAVMLSRGASPEVETSRPDGTFSGANRTGSRPSDRRDSSTAPAAALGMTITSSVTLSGAIAESKGLEFAEHAPVRIATALDISPSRPLGCARGDKKNGGKKSFRRPLYCLLLFGRIIHWSEKFP